MAWWIDRHEALPRQAASVVGQYKPVTHSASGADDVVPVTAATVEVEGITLATAAAVGDPVSVQTRGVAKVICAASIGPGAAVGVASTNGAVGPVASGSTNQRIGISEAAALPGETFSVRLSTGRVN
jgi:hypothetical protein